jgi:hypothetical protein
MTLKASPSTTSPFFANTSEAQSKRKTFATGVLPVEVFVMLLQFAPKQFTVNQVRDHLLIRTRIYLNYNSTARILKDLCNAGKLQVSEGLSRNKKICNYYSFKTLY